MFVSPSVSLLFYMPINLPRSAGLSPHFSLERDLLVRPSCRPSFLSLDLDRLFDGDFFLVPPGDFERLFLDFFDLGDFDLKEVEEVAEEEEEGEEEEEVEEEDFQWLQR